MRDLRQRLSVGVRGKIEASAAVEGGTHLVDVEYPASALGTPYPLNILAVREMVPTSIPVATNIGGEQPGRSTACQAALGVALAGADIIKLGLAKMPLGEAQEFGPALVRTVKKWFPAKRCVPVLFADERLARWYIDPIKDGPDLAAHMRAEGLLIDTYDKGIGMGLLDYYRLEDIEEFIAKCHERGLAAWVGGRRRYRLCAGCGLRARHRPRPLRPSQRHAGERVGRHDAQPDGGRNRRRGRGSSGRTHGIDDLLIHQGPCIRASNRINARPLCHPRAGGGPGKPRHRWIPACAGMTRNSDHPADRHCVGGSKKQGCEQRPQPRCC